MILRVMAKVGDATVESRLGPAARYGHRHSPVKNINEEYNQKLSLGQRVADRVAKIVGSWPFIIIQSILIVIWMAINMYLLYAIKVQPGFLKSWDPYPFILLNLMLSLQAAYTGPVVMMSQNRQADKDRLSAQQDYEVNVKAEEEIKVIMEHLIYHDRLLGEILQKVSRTDKGSNSIPIND